MTLHEAKDAVWALACEGLRAVRFSGGEPTCWPQLNELVCHAGNCLSTKHIAISTNGSAPLNTYGALIRAGANDFSVSLDACCASTGDTMAGKEGAWSHVVEAIQFLSARVYTTVGIVVTNENVGQLHETIQFAADLGVADIRVISAAQGESVVQALASVPKSLCDRFPILAYRVANAAAKVGVRGIGPKDSHRCHIALDDVAIAGQNHFPCIIYLREQGNPIGRVGPTMREDRAVWVAQHDTHADPICRANCLDCIVKYNNRYEELHYESLDPVPDFVHHPRRLPVKY
jgi:hypothetical protein